MSQTGTIPPEARPGGRPLGWGLYLAPVALAATGSSRLIIRYASQTAGLNDFTVGFDPAATAL